MAPINRRRALAGSAAVAVGVPVLAACGSDSSSGDTGSSASSGPAGETLASAADVPVGGCFVVSSAKVVVTQPAEGDFKAFTAVCTHQGCLVETSTAGDIPCPCHSSKFSLEDGSPVSGPATAALAAVDITVDGDSIVRA
jgi:nitrite reductase/ring-hydroxylating ferredoxin subunit